MAHRADEYRRLARECLTLADTGVTAKTRASLVAMAEIWARLADEQWASRWPIAAQAPRLVQQQQQQPQTKADTDNKA
jgi:hypothetical protein